MKVSHGHEVYYRVYGNKNAPRTALFVHGGPGAGCWPNHARFFDPEKWRIVLVDQRGCGASKPKGCLKGNTTQELVGDFEAIRRELGVDRWMLLGGSWGVALSLAYARAHPDRVSGLVLRGVCLMREVEIDWMFRGGAAALFPKAWSSFVGQLDTEEERRDPLTAYYMRLTSGDSARRRAAASAWAQWEMAVAGRTGSQLQVWDGETWTSRSMTDQQREKRLERRGSGHPPKKQRPASRELEDGHSLAASASHLVPSSPVSGRVPGDDGSMAQALLECHYSMNAGFLLEQPLLDTIDRIRHIPCIMVQGRLDFVCPVRTAYDLHAAWPEAELRIVPEACHSMYDPHITHELVGAVARMEEVCA